MTHKTIIVTGATDGIGKQTALELAQLGHTVIIHGRSETRAKVTVDDLRSTAPNAKLETVVGDFASLQQVRQMARELSERFSAIHVLINNAGVFAQQRKLSEDGFELTFAINHLAPFLLTNILLDKLTASVPARVVTVSSNTHLGARLNLDDLQSKRNYSGYSAYSASKLANVLFAFELAQRIDPKQITSTALHPGVISTKLLGAGWGGGGNDWAEGAETPVFLATSPNVEGVTGKYFVRKRESAFNPIANDSAIRKQLWDESAKMVGL